jgi:ATP-dependent Clp protease, protease subunit
VERLRRDTDRDRVFTASAAVEYGLVDRVLGRRD